VIPGRPGDVQLGLSRSIASSCGLGAVAVRLTAASRGLWPGRSRLRLEPDAGKQIGHSPHVFGTDRRRRRGSRRRPGGPQPGRRPAGRGRVDRRRSGRQTPAPAYRIPAGSWPRWSGLFGNRLPVPALSMALSNRPGNRKPGLGRGQQNDNSRGATAPESASKRPGVRPASSADCQPGGGMK